MFRNLSGKCFLCSRMCPGAFKMREGMVLAYSLKGIVLGVGAFVGRPIWEEASVQSLRMECPSFSLGISHGFGSCDDALGFAEVDVVGGDNFVIDLGLIPVVGGSGEVFDGKKGSYVASEEGCVIVEGSGLIPVGSGFGCYSGRNKDSNLASKDSCIVVEGSGLVHVDYNSDEEIERAIMCDEKGSLGKDEWARRRFDNWRKMKGLDTVVPIEKLEFRELAGMLEKFMHSVKKLDGSLYPSSSLMNMFRCFGRLVRREQERRVAETGVVEVPFDICKNAIFQRAQKVVEAAMNRSVRASVCKPAKKSSVVSMDVEKKVLGDIDFSLHHARGLQRRFAFYCMSRFVIRGGVELYNVLQSDFTKGSDELGTFVEYNERTSKNYKLSIRKFDQDQLRKPVRCYEEDVVMSYDQLAWYTRNRVNMKGVTLLVKNMLSAIGCGSSTFTNKSLRATAVTRMSLGDVPPDVGMLITGHKRGASYEKYNACKPLKAAAAQCILGRPLDENGKRRVFSDVLSEKIDWFQSKVDAPVGEQLKVEALVVDKIVACKDSGTGISKNVSISDFVSDDDIVCKAIEEHWPEGAAALGLKPVGNSYVRSVMASSSFHNCVVQIFDGYAGSVGGGFFDSNVRARGGAVCGAKVAHGGAVAAPYAGTLEADSVSITGFSYLKGRV